ncbi:uncharacterized protein BYT42DRAFT_413115 [Radiomyces spectabilis]|uniref:uncharacterized protein n=1 Tax=Radiomyces spectabilis TaxID=64574 RepID=UPI00221FC752|nr:uncharacterized protein BYT42DRAFT_413115 [Radiomyces spectabilis]KAI8374607.1 hypothetical protein BYT42DRAFT_413115 [Radiomyces spectabilis]
MILAWRCLRAPVCVISTAWYRILGMTFFLLFSIAATVAWMISIFSSPQIRNWCCPFCDFFHIGCLFSLCLSYRINFKLDMLFLCSKIICLKLRKETPGGSSTADPGACMHMQHKKEKDKKT